MQGKLPIVQGDPRLHERDNGCASVEHIPNLSLGSASRWAMRNDQGPQTQQVTRSGSAQLDLGQFLSSDGHGVADSCEQHSSETLQRLQKQYRNLSHATATGYLPYIVGALREEDTELCLSMELSNLRLFHQRPTRMTSTRLR
eukprot:261721-Amorphochlora_amoeboformis.AAC.2